ncbi:hypothetical protein [Streptomyces chrestomyceticus]|uniref:hypothetical protein n=1 Tax=Streptomyces chrestomyceticus TaxID=68185 RepID=UPI0033D20DD3
MHEYKIDETAIYFQVIPRTKHGAMGSPGGQFAGATLEQARQFAKLALTWDGVGVALIEPWTYKAERPMISELHDADGTVSHFLGSTDGGDGWAPGPLPREALERLGDAVRL